jgi:DNA-directed RNA polymerase subunit RPC12/RpoP
VPRPLPRERWLAETAERFAALDAGRQAHPKANWSEIEAAVEAQLGPLRAALLQDPALASDAADLGGAWPRCPRCGERLQAAGRRRRLRSEQDEPIALARSYVRCPACGAGRFPTQ